MEGLSVIESIRKLPPATKERWRDLAFSLLFSCSTIWVVSVDERALSGLPGLLMLLALVMAPAFTLYAARGLTRDPAVRGAPRKFALFIQWALAIPLLVLGICIAGWLVFSLFGWLASIPLWAAVIIVLLILK